ncbi:MAG: translation elongation factor Ts [Abditibacteriaceae bacterium]
MSTIDANTVKELRDMTGAGFMDCKNALTETEGNLDAAVKVLREKGIAAAAKRGNREASEGLIGVYVHTDGQQAAMVELNCETDFVARTDDFALLAREIGMQIVAMRPLYLSREDVPAEVLESEKAIYRQQAATEGKPEAVQDKIAEGRVEKFYSQVCLLEQGFIKDDKHTIQSMIKESIAKLGENIQIKRYIRYKVGEA